MKHMNHKAGNRDKEVLQQRELWKINSTHCISQHAAVIEYSDSCMCGLLKCICFTTPLCLQCGDAPQGWSEATHICQPVMLTVKGVRVQDRGRGQWQDVLGAKPRDELMFEFH